MITKSNQRQGGNVNASFTEWSSLEPLAGGWGVLLVDVRLGETAVDRLICSSTPSDLYYLCSCFSVFAIHLVRPSTAGLQRLGLVEAVDVIGDVSAILFKLVGHDEWVAGNPLQSTDTCEEEDVRTSYVRLHDGIFQLMPHWTE